ncbi:MAG: response regulator [Polaribacter sp.]
MYKIKLILVDDHPLFAEGLSTALSLEKDIEILAIFQDATKALSALEHTTPDLLITDISMPTMNGVEFIQKVNTQFPTIKILVVSTFQQMLSSKNIRGYLLKDTTIDEFLTAIKRIVLDDETYFKNVENENSIPEFNKQILTQREKEIVTLIAKEQTVNEIAEHLFISRLTVETHKKNIFLKLNVSTNAGLVKKGIILGFLE